MTRNPYNAEISAGSLLINESVDIARLLIKGANSSDWYQALVVENILRKKSPTSAKRMARLIRNRLEGMDESHWQLVLDDNKEVVRQALLAAAIKHSNLLYDFMTDVIRGHYRTFKRQLSLSDWRSFLEECEQRDPTVASWSDSTKKKLGQVIFRILAEGGYLESTRKLQLSPIMVHPRVRDYLLTNELNSILDCMEIDR